MQAQNLINLVPFISLPLIHPVRLLRREEGHVISIGLRNKRVLLWVHGQTRTGVSLLHSNKQICVCILININVCHISGLFTMGLRAKFYHLPQAKTLLFIMIMYIIYKCDLGWSSIFHTFLLTSQLRHLLCSRKSLI